MEQMYSTHMYEWMNEWIWLLSLGPSQGQSLGCVSVRVVCVYLVFVVAHFKTSVHLCLRLGWMYVALNLYLESIYFYLCVQGVHVQLECVQKPSISRACSLLWHNDSPLPTSPPQRLVNSNAVICRWRTQEMLPCDCVALSCAARSPVTRCSQLTRIVGVKGRRAEERCH